MPLQDLQDPIDNLYENEQFYILLESHLNYLRTAGTPRLISIPNNLNYKHEGDFYGLLSSFDLEKKYHYIILRINGLDSSMDYKGDKSIVLIPDRSEISQLENIFLTLSEK